MITVTKRTPLKRGPKPKDTGKFNVKTFLALSDDMTTGRTPIDKVTLSDHDVIDLRVIIRKNNSIAYHVLYTVRGERSYLKIGEHPSMSITEAREMATTILTLADKGVDVQDGLHARLFRELKKDGANWRPK